MEIKGIDVSAWQGDIAWATVADYGMDFAILRITEAGNVIDSKFERNFAGCEQYGIPVGVYKYSYAMNVAEVQSEARKVVSVLNGRKIQFPVFLDLEWNNQRVLGAEGVQERLRPDFGVGWQYSSKAKIPGISGNVDRNVFYKDYKDEEEDEPMGLWEKTKKLLDEQVGYLEKRSNSNLDSKTGNAGYNNYTKYSRDVNNMGLMGCQGQPWCATYQFWICAQIFGKSKALEIMGNGFYNCNSVKAHSKSKGTWHSSPKLGALVIFRNGAHIGRVISISGNTIRTNEGNTSSGGLNNVEANGGCVAEKSYTIGNSQIDGYVWIDYCEETAEPETPWKATGTATATVDNLYVRAEPNGEIIGELMRGNRFEINGVTSGKWTQVNVAGIGVGWIWTEHIQKDEVQTTEPPKQEITNKQDKTQRLFVGKVTASVLNVRTWAGTEYPQIKSYPTLNRGNLVDVMNYTQTANDGSKWYYIRIAEKYHGFVSAEYIERQ